VIEAPAVSVNPSAVVLTKAQPQPSDCMLTSLRWVCSTLLGTSTEEQYGFDQGFTEPSAGKATLRGSAVLTGSPLIDRYARFDQQEATATASSVFTSAPQDQPRSAFDGDPATTWIASSADRNPRLTITWGYSRTVSRVRIARPPGASGPVQLLIIGSGGQARGAMLGAGGVVKFKPMKTASLRFIFTPVRAPLEVSDVTIPGVPSLTTPSVPFRLPCGLGPQLKVNGIAVPTKASGTFADLLNQRPMRFTACSPVTLTAGANQVTEPMVDSFSVQDVVLTGHSHLAKASAPKAATIVSWTSSVRKLRVAAPVRSYLVVNENFNPGWRAVVDGRRLQPVRLDGWKQAWVLPAGTNGVATLTYQPESLYRDAVAGGLAALALVLLMAFLRFPRRTPTAPATVPWPQEQPAPHRPRWRRWLGLAAAVVILAGAGLVLGGYPGALLVPAATFAFAGLARTRRRDTGPWLLAGLLMLAAACGAVGEHLALSGDIGLVVSAPANAIPQVTCLIVIGGMAAALGLQPEGGQR
jgi:arabinofuranan 3-O-arabinosyltransferase